MWLLCNVTTLQQKHIKILGLESSADDTCAAVVTSQREILSNIVMRQDAELRQFGGIHPYVAIQSHQRNMPFAIRKALSEANLSINEIDGIAFTRGPGMPGCLAVAATAARSLSATLDKPLVGINHMQAHALTPFLTQPEAELPRYPFLTLLLTGGHTLLLLASSPSDYRVLAESLDSNIGFAFDRTSRALNLPPHPKGAGAALEAYCEESVSDADQPIVEPSFTTPLRNELAFSYGGLLSQVLEFLKSQRPTAINENMKLAVARAFQTTAVKHVEEKLKMALNDCRKKGLDIRDVVVSGGVASNMFLRKRLRTCLDEVNPNEQIRLTFPPVSLCTDNAAMIAWASMQRFLNGDHDDLGVGIRPTWTLENLNRPETEDKPWRSSAKTKVES
ncbi:peptidase M22 glycoprotease [Panus rudis PR-1116 ss-1]|nr:peptidase M22 glycoprotease [Panus rudis PR-1116 ss-1]